MKKILILLVLVVNFSVTTQAQKKSKQINTEQQTDLQVKKLTLKLNLTPSQQEKIKPFIAKSIAEKREIHKKKNTLKKNSKLTPNHLNIIKKSIIDEQIIFKSEMKKILSKEQYESFRKMYSKKTNNRIKKPLH